MKAVGMGERTGSKVRSRGHQRATGGSALIPPPLHQSEYSHPRLGLFVMCREFNLSMMVTCGTPLHTSNAGTLRSCCHSRMESTRPSLHVSYLAIPPENTWLSVGSHISSKQTVPADSCLMSKTRVVRSASLISNEHLDVFSEHT